MKSIKTTIDTKIELTGSSSYVHARGSITAYSSSLTFKNRLISTAAAHLVNSLRRNLKHEFH